MRMSCNGCRVLRKGCSENCSIRPCLQWIKTPESQANATVFLAKFYGRAGLMNLINSGPEHLRPAIFRSLLYEACGRIVNPIYGSVGLLWSGSWQLCQSAVEAVLKGTPIVQISSELAAVGPTPPLKAYDIRHVSKEETSAASQELHKVRTRTRFKRSGSGSAARAGCSKERNGSEETHTTQTTQTTHTTNSLVVRAQSHESSVSHPELNGGETESIFSVDTAEGSNRVGRPDPVPKFGKNEDDNENGNEDDVGLELTLGFGGAAKTWSPGRSETCCKMEMGQA